MKPAEIHPQQQRENPEPQEGSNPMPWFVMVLTALLMSFGVFYIARSALGNAPSLGDGRSTAELQGAAPAVAGAAVDGAAVFASRCVACHQASGAGLPGVFPPLAGSDYLKTKTKDEVIATVVNGLSGKVTVNSVEYTSVMPPWSHFNDDDIANILTYVYGSWDNPGHVISAQDVARVRASTKRPPGAGL